MQKTPIQLKYLPKVWSALCVFLLFIAAMVLFFGRNLAFLRSETLLGWFPDFYSHISNFSLSFVVYLISGYAFALMGAPPKYTIYTGVFLIILNLVFEFFLTVLNTRDPVDALYGITGVVLCFLFLMALQKFGLKPNNLNIKRPAE